MRDCGIYSIKQLSTGRLYVGSSYRLEKRRDRHFRDLRSQNHHSRFLQRAWNKSGEQDFRFQTLLVCLSEDLILYEQIAMDALKPEFNSCPVAGSIRGRKLSNETRKKMGEAHKGHTTSQETRKKIGAANRGRVPSKEARQKMRAAKLGRKLSESHRKKISESLAGRKLSLEHRRKIGEANSEALTGRKLSPEHRRKIAESNRRRWRTR